MPHVAVGVDAGGTSTVAVVAQDGEVLRTRAGGGANASVAGAEAAADTIATTILAALDGALPHAIFVGAAGAGRGDVASTICAALESRFPSARIGVRDDAHIALRASVPEGDGAVLIAGTGSIAYAINGETQTRCGGYGYLVGDEGSGFAIGSAAVRSALRVLDGRGRRDALVDAVLARLDAADLPQVLATLYGGGDGVASIASLAPVVLDLAGSGERSAAKIVQQAALELSDLAKTAVTRAQLQQSSAPLVLAGSLFSENTLLTFLVETRLKNDLPQMNVYKSRAQPVLGALAAAQRL